MSYGTIVKELARALGKQIIAYDNLPNHGGCILYIDGPLRRIDVDIKALDEGAGDLAAFVRRVLASPPPGETRIGIGIQGGELAVLPTPERVVERKAPADVAA